MKGILLAGGAGTRLYPSSAVVGKQLHTVYDKPMVFYPLSTLMMAGIREILVVSSPADLPRIRDLLGDGSSWGIDLSYAVQPNPGGIAQVFLIAERFLDGSACTLILGDNIFHGRMDLGHVVGEFGRGANVFGYPVDDPSSYGVVELSPSGEAVCLVEKPKTSRSNLAVTGLYLYDGDVVDHARQLVPSPRGELEITDLNRRYLQLGQLSVTELGRDIAWFDSGTHESLLETANFVATVEKRQGLKIACLEEVAYNMGFIDMPGLERAIEAMPRSPYRDYVERVARAVQRCTSGVRSGCTVSP